MNEVYHTPVLLKDCIDVLQIIPNGTYVDVTFGGGGHSREILRKLSDGKLFGFDCDEDAEKNKIADKRFTLIARNFRDLKVALLEKNVTGIDGLLADLGVSSHQFDTAERGFSTRLDSTLDMRMNRKIGRPVSDILRTYSEDQLKRIFREHGELRNAPQVVKKIMANRKQLRTVNELKNAIASCAERGKENRFYAKVFQALRIEVNDELNALKNLLMQSIEVLKPGGRMAVISYHSLEDRLVKNFFRSGKFEGEIEKDIYGNVKAPFKVINRKPIVPGEEEMQENSRARSAKLRIAERVNR
ncbi:MAG: 16S rRNA (cytosine(1402)-N(4))-methyltransferase RsmH [Bacteroidetes bacterium]|nr:MAG: 16S rRNA (cytosine(1402)-N(4))-methyltransferase RsmH [Bacteroidota bacterium]